MEERIASIHIVDDDPSVRKGLARLMESFGHNVRSYGSAEEFLSCHDNRGPGCIILDVRMPGRSGLDLQNMLAEESYSMPIIFISGHGSIPVAVSAIKGGAVSFLPKPFEESDLLAAIDEALAKDIETRKRHERRAKAQGVLDALTPREYDVFQLVITGMLNKQIAAELAISEKTVKVHRGRVMSKTGASSVAELVRLAGKAGLPSGAPAVADQE